MPVTIQITLPDEAVTAIAHAIAKQQEEGRVAVQNITAEVVSDTPVRVPSEFGYQVQGTPQVTPPQPDPWQAQPAPQQPAPVPTAASAGWSQPAPAASSAPVAGPPSNGAHTVTDRWGNTYTFGLPSAHTCNHGERAVLKNGVSKAGNAYQAWVCPKSANDYKNDCKFYVKA